MSLLGNQTFVVCLTARELEVVAFVAAGFSAKEIALRIFIRPRTVERHIESARLKMRARNRTHLVTRAIASGLLDMYEPDEKEAAAQPALVRDLNPDSDAFVLF